ncbi:hypothetical protein [Komagataeibacter oboediens]|uniref:Uncharacterized protein n=1 Tax=Komagataeibacter oboediens TaxID=65958 RepID=A0ABS5SSD3_9PROT|nr:hypothetical protein [Komagataeibacter oboediens]MBL7233355.1 hypothetical protein [Komagataeibacter oboediens]MBT0676657.1 hypothetical protein [Komagataeibacter oboediens]MBT0678182.1 hypothetical protein [Komagataeibacter oboediens]
MKHNLALCLLPAFFSFISVCNAQEAQDICKIYRSSKEDSSALMDKYQSDVSANDSNSVRHEALVNADKAALDRAFSSRNDAIYRYTVGGRVRSLDVIVDKVDSSVEDNGEGDQNYGYINAHIPCDPKISIVIPKIPVDSRWKPLLSSLNTGDSIEVSGHLIAHDEDAQKPADAIQWAGPLWGILWDLRPETFLAPSLQINPSKMQQIPTQHDG